MIVSSLSSLVGTGHPGLYPGLWVLLIRLEPHTWLLLLLFRHSAKSLNAQEHRLAISPLMVTRFHLPHAIVVRLHVRKGDVVILTPETVVTVAALSVAHLCR